ncbi:hypothetical protein BT63DRAFT_236500 [Microthyrium microscopicum]|uniref:F-box domain-containing protein n=1 Tax=Microthyrium microscopicum TaxID=703497 RepID=A0A6A6UFN7_9PEZI|nr:hypothetical protein BT63DRAFT_236500 [Microthyrium microscopicum]
MEEDTRTFPFMKIPIELRIIIYELALFPRATFALFSPMSDEKHLPEGHDQWWYSKGKRKEHVLSYQFALSPLLLVCKQIHHETKPVMRSYHNTVQSSFIHEDVIAEPHPLFISICENSRFVLDSFGKINRKFLEQSLAPVHLAVRSIIIKSHCLFLDDGPTSLLWSGDNDAHWLPFTQSLIRMPALEEVAIYVPSEEEGDWYCSQALPELSELLELGKLRRLWYLFTDPNIEAENSDYLERALRPEVPEPLEDYWKACEESEKSPDRFSSTRDDQFVEAICDGYKDGWQALRSAFRLERVGEPIGDKAVLELSDGSDSDDLMDWEDQFEEESEEESGGYDEYGSEDEFEDDFRTAI